jgi:perosamine synthetase
MKYVPLATPSLGMRERINVWSAIQKNELSGYSKQFVTKFEEEFAHFVGVKFALSVNSGTSALTLAIRALNLKPGDKVAVSALTNMATYFPILQVGAIPIPVDIDPHTLNIDPSALRNVMKQSIKAIVIVHLYGLPVTMDEILKIANRSGVPIIEDCAESLGATYAGIQTGAFGQVGCFSFYANKIITTGEGGMVTTNSEETFEQMKSLRSLGFGFKDKFLHESDGYNFRMSNIQAAIGVGQLSSIKQIISKKRKIASLYNSYFKNNIALQLPSEPDFHFSVYWMYALVLKSDSNLISKDVISKLGATGIEAREGFIPFSDQTKLIAQFGLPVSQTPIASSVSPRIFYLPSGPNISKREIKFVAESVNRITSSLK